MKLINLNHKIVIELSYNMWFSSTLNTKLSIGRLLKKYNLFLSEVYNYDTVREIINKLNKSDLKRFYLDLLKFKNENNI